MRLAENGVGLRREPDEQDAPRLPKPVPPPRPKITPDDPIYALFDAVKAAQAEYTKELHAMARRYGLPAVNMAAVLRAARSKARRQVGSSRPLTPAEFKAKFMAMSPAAQARVTRVIDELLAKKNSAEQPEPPQPA